MTEKGKGSTFHSHGQYHGWINQGLDPFFRGCLSGGHCNFLGVTERERNFCCRSWFRESRRTMDDGHNLYTYMTKQGNVSDMSPILL